MIGEPELLKVACTILRTFRNGRLNPRNVRRQAIELFKHFKVTEFVFQVQKALLNTFQFNFLAFRDKDFMTALQIISREVFFTPNLFYQNGNAQKQMIDNFYSLFGSHYNPKE